MEIEKSVSTADTMLEKKKTPPRYTHSLRSAEVCLIIPQNGFLHQFL